MPLRAIFPPRLVRVKWACCTVSCCSVIFNLSSHKILWLFSLSFYLTSRRLLFVTLVMISVLASNSSFLMPTTLLSRSSWMETVPAPSARSCVGNLSIRVSFVLCTCTFLVCLARKMNLKSCLGRRIQNTCGGPSSTKLLLNVLTWNGLAMILPAQKSSWTQPQSSTLVSMN